MKFLLVLITHERLAYTKRTLRAIWDTIGDDTEYFLTVVDNASTDGTQDYLKKLQQRGRINGLILNDENLYPGEACNRGWETGLKIFDADLLVRLDNDMSLVRGWDKRVVEYFKAIPELGQLGLDHEAIEHPSADLRRRTINGLTINEWPGCVGGPSVIRRKLWEDGIRWPDLRWNDERNSAAQEDSAFSKSIMDKGFLVGHAQEELGRTFANKSNWADFPSYYEKTMSDRGYQENANYIKELKK